jgi:hypothetical protein
MTSRYQGPNLEWWDNVESDWPVLLPCNEGWRWGSIRHPDDQSFLHKREGNQKPAPKANRRSEGVYALFMSGYGLSQSTPPPKGPSGGSVRLGQAVVNNAIGFTYNVTPDGLP